MQDIYKKIRNHPDFLNLVQTRKRISWLLTTIIIFCYFTLIIIIAFRRSNWYSMFECLILDKPISILGFRRVMPLVEVNLYCSPKQLYTAPAESQSEKKLQIMLIQGQNIS